MPVRAGVLAVIAAVFVVFGLGSTAPAAEFACTDGNVTCLVAAIRAANGLGEPSTILLAQGVYTLTAVDNTTDGPNGLPSITGTLTIRGPDAQVATIERSAAAPGFRLVHVAPTGALTLEGLTLRGGSSGPDAQFEVFPGGGILNAGGRVTLRQSRVTNNQAAAGGFRAYGGGLFNRAGTVLVSSSTIADNVVGAVDSFGGGLAMDGGAMTIMDSAIVDNLATGTGATGGGIAQSFFGNEGPAVVEIVNSTIARNRASGRFGSGGGLASGRGQWTITNSTIAGNAASGLFANGGGIVANGPLSLQNTLVAQNALSGTASGFDCSGPGPVTSLGHNIVGDPIGCPTPQPTDRTGPGLAFYVDDDAPGRAHWPLLPTSQAIGGGEISVCPQTDQLGRSRLGRCDIGAVQFVPAVDPRGDFVRGFYRYALGREPGPAEVVGWLSFLGANPALAGARVMTHTVFDGAEYRARRPFTSQGHVTALYAAVLGRDPDLRGLVGWVELLENRRREMQGIFLGSAEFQALVPSCQDEPAVRALVTRLYEKLLGRPRGIGEGDTWVSNIMTVCRVDIVLGFFLTSEEYLRVPRTLAEQVTNLYRALLAREPRPDEVAGWVDYLAPPFIEDQFIDGPEFMARWRQLVS